MTYEVVILRRAEQELHAAADWIAASSATAAERWFDGFVEAILSLERNPERCGSAYENDKSVHELRQLIYRPGKGRAYRAIFTIAGRQVRVLRIRGAGQDSISGDELGS